MSTKIPKISRLRATTWCLGGLVFACSSDPHDCAETRTCPHPYGYVEAGTPADDGQAWGEAGAGGDPLWPSPRGSGDTTNAGEGGEAGAAGEAGAPESPSADTAPRVLSVSPADHAIGVTNDTKIVVTFDRPMAEAVTEAAFHGTDLPPSSVTFSWNTRDTVLTITPSAPLIYAAATPSTDGSVPFPAKQYHLAFDATARDRQGRSLEPVTSVFSTLRELSVALAADPERSGTWTNGEGEGLHDCTRQTQPPYVPTVCVGDDLQNVKYDGFLSFDLTPLPPGLANISSARLLAHGLVYGTPDRLGESSLSHVSFAELDASTLNAKATPLIAFYGLVLPSGSPLALSVDLSHALTEDYQAGKARSQYRLSFDHVTPNGIWDDVELPTSKIQLSVNALLP